MDIKVILSDITVIGVCSGVIGLLTSRLQGRLGKSLSLLTSLILLSYIFIPVLDHFNDIRLGDSNTLPFFTKLPDEYTDAEDYYEKLISLTLDNIKESELLLIKEKTGLEESDMDICFSGSIADNRFEVEGCRIVLKSIRAIARREELRKYLDNKYGVKTEFTENAL